MSGKKRLDVLLAARGLCPSRQRAKEIILRGDVTVEGRVVQKPGAPVAEEAAVHIHHADMLPYASRGGQKLEKALALWPIDLTGCLCLDVGASTGGFTDCMLRGGARKVYAVDVGRGQLLESLRRDPRVVCLEGVNARYLTEAQVPETVDFISIDVSFISINYILPAVAGRLHTDGQIVCLIKPQFEAGRGNVGKRGVVRDPAVHRAVLERFTAYTRRSGFTLADLTFSPIRGPEGNIEYLGLLTRGGPTGAGKIEEVVACAHRELPG